MKSNGSFLLPECMSKCLTCVNLYDSHKTDNIYLISLHLADITKSFYISPALRKTDIIVSYSISHDRSKKGYYNNCAFYVFTMHYALVSIIFLLP